MFFKLLAFSFLRRKSLTLLSLTALWIGMTMVVAFLFMVVHVGDKLNQELASLGSNIRIEPIWTASGQVHSFSHSYLQEKELFKLKKDIFWRNNIVGLVPKLRSNARLWEKEVPVLGLWIQKKIPITQEETFTTGATSMYGHWKIQGNWPLSKKECLVGIKLAEGKKIRLHQQIELQSSGNKALWKVVGIVSTGEETDNAVVASLSEVQDLCSLKGMVSEVDVSAVTTPEKHLAEKYRKDPKSLTPEEYERWACTPYPGTIAAQIEANLSQAKAQVVRRISETQGQVLGRIEGLLFWLSLLTLLLSSLSVMGILNLMILRRRQEIALFQALGATRGDILFLFFWESTFLGLLGSALSIPSGYFLGQSLIQMIFETAPELAPGPLILAPLLGLVVAWMGNLFPLWQILNQKTAQILKGN